MEILKPVPPKNAEILVPHVRYLNGQYTIGVGGKSSFIDNQNQGYKWHKEIYLILAWYPNPFPFMRSDLHIW